MTSPYHLINKYMWRPAHRAFNDIRNKQRIFKAKNKSTKKCAKACPKLKKTSKWHDRCNCGIPVVKSGQVRSDIQRNASSIHIEHTFLCKVDVQLIFKSVKRNEKVYTKRKSEKITEADSAPRNRS